MSEVAVIGGGWAGCAAAVALAQQGARVTLYEAAAMLGGRARTVVREGLPLDNGQHVLLAGYSATRALMDTLHEGSAPVHSAPLAIAPLDARQRNALLLRARPWRPPLGIAMGLLTARGLSLRERIGTLRVFHEWKKAGFRCGANDTVQDLLAPMPQAAASRLWEPLCVSALNTPAAHASGQVFLNVLAASFDGAADAAELLWPTVTLGEAVPAAAGRFLGREGHAVRSTATATVALRPGRRLRVQCAGIDHDVDAVVVAVGPHQLERTFTRALAAEPGVRDALLAVAQYRYESITTAYLGYRGLRVALPAGLVRLDDAPGQWVFARDDILQAALRRGTLDQLLAVVISTGGAHDTMAQPELARLCDEQLRRGHPALPPLAWSRVIAERRATYACVPGLVHPPVRLRAGLYLAGDYMYPHFPATLEAAVRSGTAAAEAFRAEAAATATAPAS